MAAIALAVPTVVAQEPNALGGHCYIIFPELDVVVRELIEEKVRAELRKVRAAGPEASSVGLLLPGIPEPGLTPLDEQQATDAALRGFTSGHYVLVVDGHPQNDLDATIQLSRRSNIFFLAKRPVQQEQA